MYSTHPRFSFLKQVRHHGTLQQGTTMGPETEGEARLHGASYSSTFPTLALLLESRSEQRSHNDLLSQSGLNS